MRRSFINFNSSTPKLTITLKHWLKRLGKKQSLIKWWFIEQLLFSLWKSPKMFKPHEFKHTEADVLLTHNHPLTTPYTRQAPLSTKLLFINKMKYVVEVYKKYTFSRKKQKNKQIWPRRMVSVFGNITSEDAKVYLEYSKSGVCVCVTRECMPWCPRHFFSSWTPTIMIGLLTLQDFFHRLFFVVSLFTARRLYLLSDTVLITTNSAIFSSQIAITFFFSQSNLIFLKYHISRISYLTSIFFSIPRQTPAVLQYIISILRLAKFWNTAVLLLFRALSFR